ncbi:3-dehydroquinate dehydratase [Hujiaoplasma nucleasis]|uniref:3-dehydroquinate dehydratase n=1 Tax=Hujiaoplasma nucleasis TaxID=2725268 RepID=A0A7L6N5A2_9MOLU|nr:type II 3-dehydroquinate dehydratase [Hujiaoplasma nucleasis]QLY40447.1 3-dehydroquinate dehydratase [Hujiaoplasma nucleasis]
MNILIINGPNLNLLGTRETEIYGNSTYKVLVQYIKKYAKVHKVSVKIYQSNHEGKIIDYIQKHQKKYQAIIINPGAFTHYSYAIRDCLSAYSLKKIEVHLSNIYEREDFRKVSVIKDVVDMSVLGKGFDSYIEAIDLLLKGEIK